MKMISDFVKWFLYITTGIMIVCGINYTLAGIETVPVDIFWKILLCGFLTTFVTVLLFPEDEDSKVNSYIKLALHFALLCMVMIPLGMWFGWVGTNLTGVLVMIANVGGVYFGAAFAYFVVDCRQAEKINKKLKEKYGEDV